MRRRRLREEDGFIREILWVALGVAILAIVVLDGMAIFRANEAASNDAARAANEARIVYSETTDLGAARQAAEGYLERSGHTMSSFDTRRNLEGQLVFVVGAQTHAETRVFKYLGNLGLRKWVDRLTNPSAVGESN